MSKATSSIKTNVKHHPYENACSQVKPKVSSALVFEDRTNRPQAYSNTMSVITNRKASTSAITKTYVNSSDFQNYLNTDRNVLESNKSVVQETKLVNFPTEKTVIKSILKKKPVMSNQTKPSKPHEDTTLKFFTGTTKSICFYTTLFNKSNQQTIKNSVRQKAPKEFLFEIVAQLDSTISEVDALNSRRFAIKDTLGRMNCIFYEIDSQLGKLPRGKYIRCVGNYDQKQNLFKCISVRLVTDKEIELNAKLYNTTQAYIVSQYNSSKQ